MGNEVSGLRRGESLPGGVPVGPQKKTGKAKSLGGVTVTNKTSEASSSVIGEARKNISTNIGETTSKRLETRVVNQTQQGAGFTGMVSEGESSIAGVVIPQVEEGQQEVSADDIESMVFMSQQRKKTEEEQKSGAKKRVRGSEGEEEEVSPEQRKRVGEGQATGEREEGGGEEKRKSDLLRMINGVAQSLDLKEEEAKTFVDQYQSHVLNFERVSETFSKVMEEAKGNVRVFNQILNRLIKGIGIELAAQESTLDPVHLRQIMQELYRVQICAQVNQECDLLLRDMNNLYGT